MASLKTKSRKLANELDIKADTIVQLKDELSETVQKLYRLESKVKILHYIVVLIYN